VSIVQAQVQPGRGFKTIRPVVPVRGPLFSTICVATSNTLEVSFDVPKYQSGATGLDLDTQKGRDLGRDHSEVGETRTG
jgi:hypothetical protein